MTPDETESTRPKATFRTTLVRVLAVQALSLLVLWLLQARYGG